MQTHQLDRMLRLAQKTGGKLIITDAAGNKPVIILGLEEYEKLLDTQTSHAPRQAMRPAAVAPSVAAPGKQFDGPVLTEDDESLTAEDSEDSDSEDEADVTMMEEALLAVEESMPEEPKVVPVKAEETEAEVPVSVQKERAQPSAARPIPAASEVGEEQFYLEPL